MSDRLDAVPAKYRELWIGASPETTQLATIVTTGMQSGRPLLVTSLAEDRTASETLTGLGIYVESSRVPRDEAPVWGDLPGATVVDAAGVTLGTVEDVYNSGASDIVIVKRTDGKTLDLPLAPQYVDVDRGIAPGKLMLLVPGDVFEELWA